MEIKANELRIGNYIIENIVKDGVGIIKGIDLVNAENTKCIIITERQTTPIEYISPIPLTEEILLKCGFNFGVILQDFCKGQHCFVKLSILNGYFSYNGIFYYNEKVRLKYLHQLQNLYFALTNQELEIQF